MAILDRFEIDSVEYEFQDQKSHNLAAQYSTLATYAVGDYCIKDGDLYKCTTAITTAEAWTAAHWTAAQIAPDHTSQSEKIDEVKSVLINQGINYLPQAMQEEIGKYTDIPAASVTFYDDKTYDTSGNLSNSSGRFAVTFSVNAGDKLHFSYALFGYSSSFPLLLCKGSSVVQAITDSGLVNNPNSHYYLTIPIGVDNIKSTGSLSVKSNAVIQRFTFDSVANVPNIQTLDGRHIRTVGKGGYATIQAACDAANANDIIFIRCGTYREQVSIWQKKLHLVGEDRDNVILIDSSGNYNTPPLEMNLGSVSNMTIIEDGASQGTGELDGWAYCIHIEAEKDSTVETFYITNCDLTNDVHAPIGCGLRNNYTVYVKNCTIRCNATNEGTKERGSLFFHAQNGTNIIGQHMIVEGCAISSAGSFAVLINTPINASGGNATYQFNGNTVWTDTNGQNSTVTIENANKGIMTMVNSYNNNVPELNNSNTAIYPERVMSRQGEGYGYPDNSIEGVTAALNDGYKKIRISVGITSDNVLYCTHAYEMAHNAENNVLTYANGTAYTENVEINSTTSTLLDSLRYKGYVIPTLDAMMSAISGYNAEITLELKGVWNATTAKVLIDDYFYYAMPMIISGDYYALQYFMQVSTDVNYAWIFNYSDSELETYLPNLLNKFKTLRFDCYYTDTISKTDVITNIHPTYKLKLGGAVITSTQVKQSLLFTDVCEYQGRMSDLAI